MSFEGYYQTICQCGHYSIKDCNDSGPYDKCHCGLPIVWENLVDETNCEGDGFIFPENLFLCEYEGTERYRIPTLEEEQELKTYRKSSKGCFTYYYVKNNKKVM